jgi:hypothetical protein
VSEESTPAPPRGPLDLVTVGAVSGALLLGVGLALSTIEPDGRDALPLWVSPARISMSVGLLLLLAGTLAWWWGRGRRAPESEGPEAWLCRHCIRPYAPGAHFCPRCGAPLDVFAMTAPYERIYANTWLRGLAAHHPSHWTQVVTILGAALGAALQLVAFLIAWPRMDPPLLAVGLFALTDLLALAVIALAVYQLRALLSRGPTPGWLRPYTPYGTGPWWTYDAAWALPEEVEPPPGAPPDMEGEDPFEVADGE